jgi:tRNA G18 (ribose-2'-O)-methylase SpoU
MNLVKETLKWFKGNNNPVSPVNPEEENYCKGCNNDRLSDCCGAEIYEGTHICSHCLKPCETICTSIVLALIKQPSKNALIPKLQVMETCHYQKNSARGKKVIMDTERHASAMKTF